MEEVNLVGEEVENVAEGRVENVVDERMENIHEYISEVEDRMVTVRNPPEREVPVSGLERSSLEEDPQGAPRRRNHSPIRFDRVTSPEASGSLVKS